MGYADFEIDSDVHVYLDGSLLVCSDCWLNDQSQTFDTSRLALNHLEEHTKAGHQVTDYTIEAIKDDFPNLDLVIKADE